MRKLIALLLLLPPVLSPQSVYAHAFGQLYTLPIPVWLYLYGGGAAILISFILIGYFVGASGNRESFRTFNISKLPLVHFLTSDKVKFFLKLSSILLFSLTVAAGYIGNKTPIDNFSPLFVWIIFWLGFTYLTALFGNLWNLLNPWKIIIELVENIKGSEFKGFILLPKNIGYFPALLFFYIFIWLELLSNGWGVRPVYLSNLIVLYTAANLLGAILLGKNIWFKYCEFFSVFFKLVAKLSPVEIKKHKLFLRPPFIGLLKD